MKKNHLSVTLTTLLLIVYSVQGQGMTFTDKTTFLNALPGPAGVLNFDSLAGGTILSGTTLTVTGGPGTGITFPVVDDILGNPRDKLNLIVVMDNGNNPTTSNPNSLGTDDPANYNTIVGGTVIDLGLTSPVEAFGLSFITPDTMFNDDIRLAAGGETASLVANDRTLVGNFNGSDYYAYFLGVIGSNVFTSASIQYGPDVSGGPFLYNADDITVAAPVIPEPDTLVLLLGGVLALLFQRDRRRSGLNRTTPDLYPLTTDVD
ncbi:MAG: hypothetical protein U1F76_01975 [Candidatus Competibacteraceae bacterium]